MAWRASGLRVPPSIPSLCRSLTGTGVAALELPPADEAGGLAPLGRCGMPSYREGSIFGSQGISTGGCKQATR
ncbi:hypothetical protein RRF57_000224 [Xylaria bambusicola]|uniref:Uncharacterized protein n=1 Tax=Xylaria bambusicola TaxID=326684 RepID=A0AAN7U9T8_9PEZI